MNLMEKMGIDDPEKLRQFILERVDELKAKMEELTTTEAEILFRTGGILRPDSEPEELLMSFVDARLSLFIKECGEEQKIRVVTLESLIRSLVYLLAFKKGMSEKFKGKAKVKEPEEAESVETPKTPIESKETPQTPAPTPKKEVEQPPKEKSEKKEKIFACSDCGEQFPTAYRLRKHREICPENEKVEKKEEVVAPVEETEQKVQQPEVVEPPKTPEPQQREPEQKQPESQKESEKKVKIFEDEDLDDF